jgi:hypothetical protein
MTQRNDVDTVLSRAGRFRTWASAPPSCNLGTTSTRRAGKRRPVPAGNVSGGRNQERQEDDDMAQALMSAAPRLFSAGRVEKSPDPADTRPRRVFRLNPRNRPNRRRSGRRYYAGIFGRPPWMTADSLSPAEGRSSRASNPREASPCRLSCGTVRNASGSPVHGWPKSRLPRLASVLRHIHTTGGICGIPFARPRFDSSTQAGLRTRGAWLTVTG